MAVTVQNIADDALREIGAAGGDTVSMSTAEKANVLRMINGFLDSWYSMKLLYPRTTEDTHTLTADTESYTIGSGGDIDTVRPIKVVEAWIRDSNNNDYNVRIIGEDQYFGIESKKTGTGRPYLLFYDPQVTLGKIYLYSIPDNSTDVLHIRSLKPFTQFSAITESVTLSPAEQRAITKNFAIEIAPSYNRPAKPELIIAAKEAREALEEANRRLPEVLITDLPIYDYYKADIRSDSP